MHLCPACGFEQGEAPWQNGVGSQEICPCCGLQFGYQDACGGRSDLRPGFYIGWRVRWIWKGHPWHSADQRPTAGHQTSNFRGSTGPRRADRLRTRLGSIAHAERQ